VAASASQAWQGFLAQSAIPVVARIGGSVPPRVADGLNDLCGGLSPTWPPMVRCASANPAPGQPEPLELQVDAVIQRAVETIAEDVRSLRYLSGTRQVYNPEFRQARKRLAQAEGELQDAERRKKGKEEQCRNGTSSHDATCVDCPEGKKKTPCEEANELTEEVKGRARARNEASNSLSNTPEMLTEEMYENFNYSVMTHRWASGFRFTLRSSTPGAAPVPQQSGLLSFEDQEHVGFSPGGLQPDPLQVPPAEAYSSAFLQQLAPHAFAAVKQDSEFRAAARRAQCAQLPADWSTPWVQCWAESALWGSGQQPQVTEFLSVLATSAGASEQPLCR
jgi:hypothetical protein